MTNRQLWAANCPLCRAGVLTCDLNDPADALKGDLAT
jgi:hypothetical protein